MQEAKEQHYFAKFLTNQKLLELQLSDSNFRRCVLIQFLILFQYLTSTVKYKTEELKSDQVEWVKETENLVYCLLGDTPPCGKAFAENVRHILKREDHWNNWKNEGCPEFQKPKSLVTTDSDEVKKAKKRRRPVGDIIKEYSSQEKYYLGNNDLTKLWNLCPDNLAACRKKERDFMPSLESYMLSGMERGGAATGGGGGGGGGVERTRCGAWGWRALRLLARRSPHFFVHTNNPIGRLPDYLDSMVKRVYRDLTASTAASTNEESANSNDNKIVKQEQAEGEEEQADNEEQIVADLIKAGDATDIEQVPDSTHAGEEDEEKMSRSHVTMISPAQLEAVSAQLTSGWKKLAMKLGFQPAEVDYIQTENATDLLRAKNMLLLWFDDDEDASIESLIYILDGLELFEASAVLKSSK